MLNLNQFTIYTASWLTAAAALWKLFGYLAEVSSENLNRQVTNWIKGINWNTNRPDSKTVVYALFLSFFGEKHFTVKCFLKSALYTLTIYLILFLIISVHEKEKYGFFLDVYVFYIILIVMIIQDYLSLFVTRTLLKKIVKSKINNIFTVFVLSFLITLLISSIITIPVIFMMFSFSESKTSVMKFIWKSYVQLISPALNSDDLLWQTKWGAFLNTIYLGTFWIMLIQGAGVFTKITSLLFKYFNIFRSFIDIQKKPIKSLGVILILFLFVSYLISLPIFFVIKR